MAKMKEVINEQINNTLPRNEYIEYPFCNEKYNNYLTILDILFFIYHLYVDF